MSEEITQEELREDSLKCRIISVCHDGKLIERRFIGNPLKEKNLTL